MLQASTITNSSEVTRMAAISTRNIILGVIAVFNSLVVFILIIITTNLKMPIKITLLNLLACDMALMMNGLVYGWFVQTKLESGHSLCSVTIFLMIDGFFLSHAAVAGISLNNFLAIFYPFKHNILVTTKSVAISVLITWLLLSFISAICFVFHIPQNEPCVVLSSVPRYGAIVIFSVLFLIDFSVIVMNASLCKAIRKRKQVHVNTVFSVYRGRWAQHRTLPLQLPQQFQLERSQNQHENHDHTIEHKREDGITGDSQSKKRSGMNSLRCNPFLNSNKQEKGSQQHKKYPQQNESKSKKKCLLKVTYSRNNINVKIEPQPSSSSSSDKPLTSGSNLDEKDVAHAQTQNETPVTTGYPLVESIPRIRDDEIRRHVPPLTKPHSDLCLMSSSTTSRTHMKRNQFRRLSVSMIIISIWCCVFNVPCSLYLFYVAFIAENRLQANYSTLGIIFTTLLSINVMGDPFIYAWRFVQWRVIIKKFRKLFCCGQ